MVTKNINNIDKLDAYWASKLQKTKNAYKRQIGVLTNKIIKLKKRAQIDYKIIHKFGDKDPEFWKVYDELHQEGINTYGYIRKPSKRLITNENK